MLKVIEQPFTKRKIVSRDEWVAARRALLLQEKELTRRRDELSSKRAELPWVKIEKEYVFDSPAGRETLPDLFAGRGQLAVYHFMFGPGWEQGCPGCSFVCDHLDGANLHLAHHDVTVVAASRGGWREFEPYKKRMGWKFKWVSSGGSDFNYDFHVSATPEELAAGKMNYNFNPEAKAMEEVHGLSTFYKDEQGIVYHRYSTFGRGCEPLIGAYNYLDLMPKGRNEHGAHKNMADWMRRHDEYVDA